MKWLSNNEITVRWVIPPTGSPLVQGDYDIRVIPGHLSATYTDGGLSSYTAPTSEYSGVLDYVFTPTTPGLWTILLCTGSGAASTVIDEKKFWVFSEEALSANSLNAIGPLSRATAIPPLSNIAIFELNWYLVISVCQDPVDYNIFYCVGKVLVGDTNYAVGKINRSAGTWETFKTIDFVPFDCACTDEGVLTVQRQSPIGNKWSTVASDFATWTDCTFNSSLSGHGVIGMDWDELYEIMFFRTNAGIWTSLDGKAFYQTQWDAGFPFSNIEAFYYYRSDINGVNRFWTGSTTPFSGQEGTYTGIYAVPQLTVPPSYTLMNRPIDLYGPTVSTQQISSVCSSHGDTHVIMASKQGYVIRQTTNSIGAWILPPINLTSHLAGGTMDLVGRVNDFNKNVICITNTGASVWLESTDNGATWSASADARFTQLRIPQAGSTDKNMRPADGGTSVVGIHYNATTYDVFLPTT